MDFYKDQFFHIYNQGNNQEDVFFSEENYKFFFWKMRAYLPPFGKLISWCLMPNHFHWLFYVEKTELYRKEALKHIDAVEYQRRILKYGENAKRVERNLFRRSDKDLYTINEAIGDLLKGYAKAINYSRNRSGSLFRQECKAKDGWIDEFITLKNKGQDDYRFRIGSSYAYQCLCYIHENPVEAGLTQRAQDHAWSSAALYFENKDDPYFDLTIGRNLLKFN
jgi:putative transposase